MNIEAYDLDSLRKIVRALQIENEALKSQLKKADIAFDATNPFEETIERINEYDPDQGEARGMLANSVAENRPKPWKKKEGLLSADVVGKVH